MTYVAVSNSSLHGVREGVRAAAVCDFEYFVNTVCGSRISEELCDVVQFAVELREDAFIRFQRTHALASMLHSWLVSQGFNVLSEVPPSKSDILDWLEFDCVAQPGEAVAITLSADGVNLQWL